MNIYTECHMATHAHAIIVLVHGAGEYFARYEWLAGRLNEAGYHVIGGDLPGLGRSEGRRGHIDDFHQYYRAIDEWLARAYVYEKPVFLIGHSMGGLISIRYMEEKQPDIAGVVLSSPCLGLVRSIPPWLNGLASMLNAVVPRLRLSAGIGADEVSRDSLVAERYGTDPYITTRVSVRWYKQLSLAMEAAYQEADQYPAIPTLLMQAGDDRIVDVEAVRRWVRSQPVECIDYVEWSGLYHEIFNEPEKTKVVDQLLSWLADHI
ncbi:alpha/beta hydrolase [Aneurinibacillus soli]|nr:alpha/beta hydrolase [Aneurinibacillus soli]